MESSVEKTPSEVNKKEINGFKGTDSNRPGEADSAAKEDAGLSLSEDSDGSLDEKNFLSDNDQNQVALYDPLTNLEEENVHAPEPLNSQPPTFSRKDPTKILPSVAAYTVQCANCLKWRLIPTKDKYEEIRENIAENPFYCESASEWRSGVSCEDPGDIQQDNSRLWAIDKHSIARPPPGWQRIIRIRGEGSLRFADVYYEAPSGKRFRSLIEIQKYLAEIPDLAAGISLSQFSFLIPKPLQDDYVKKRPSGMKSSRSQESDGVRMSFPGRPDDLHNGQPETFPSSFETPPDSSADQSAKKRAKKSSTEDITPLS